MPTLTSVSIDSDNAETAATAETATNGDTVTLTLVGSETLSAGAGKPACAFTLNSVAATNSDTVTNTGGNTWTCVFDLANADANAAVAFTITFDDLAGNAGEWTGDRVGTGYLIHPGAWDQPSLAAWAKALTVERPESRWAGLGFRLARD